MRFHGKPHLCAAKYASRYAMHGIRFERDGLNGKPALISTDGRRLVVIPCELEAGESVPEKPVIVDAEAVKAAVKASKTGRKLEPTLALNGGATVPHAPGSPGFAYLDGEFPQWRSVCTIPDPSRRRIAFNAKLLAEIAEALGDECVEIELPTLPEAPIRVSVGGCDGRFGVLMPVQIDRPPRAESDGQ